jgi:double-stranded uracil-DNA glycosylase
MDQAVAETNAHWLNIRVEPSHQRSMRSYSLRRAAPKGIGLENPRMKSSGFDAVAGPDARVLILGTLPGAVSLACGQYYAQPRNAFWRIMGELVGASLELPYAERVERLVAARIAVWDVCAIAQREGSADAAIQPDTIQPNDFATFFRTHPHIELICFNGAKAAELFRRRVSPTLESPASAMRQIVLPSTSPANAAMPFVGKLSEWRAALQPRH